MAAVLAVVLTLFLLAAPLERLLGPTGINVVTRLLGMLLAGALGAIRHRRNARSAGDLNAPRPYIPVM